MRDKQIKLVKQINKIDYMVSVMQEWDSTTEDSYGMFRNSCDALLVARGMLAQRLGEDIVALTTSA